VSTPIPGPQEQGVEPWQRVHIASPFVRAGRSMIALVIVFILSLNPTSQGSNEGGLIGHAIALLIAAVVGFLQWIVTRWRIENGALRIETGILRRSSQRFPLDQIQAVDTVRSGLARVLGVSELRLRMAGHSGKAGRLAYLKHEEAERVRARLLALAHGVAEHEPEPPENVLLSIRTDRLLGSLFLSPFGALWLVIVIGLIVSLVVSPAVLQLLSGSVPVFLGFVIGFWRRFNSGYHLTVAEAPDGLRLRSGLVETTAETIPRGRIQAVRMSEPLLWRWLGWCRLEVSVAGRQRRKGENRAEARSNRMVLPVGDKQEAAWLLSRIIPDAPNELQQGPPERARLKAPFSFHFLSWQRNDTCAVTSHGRLEKVTDWVPFSKVQSLRVTQGPVQRRLRLVDVHLDTADSGIHAELTDRDSDEIPAIIEELIEKCRRNRAATARRPNSDIAVE
jgi:putative membrane protein